MEINDLDFTPLPFLSSGYFQTVIGSFGMTPTLPDSSAFVVNLSDGDKIWCDVTISPQWKPTNPTVVTIHGLAGTNQSLYLMRLTNKLIPLGYRVIRVNLRGCGAGEKIARLTYHGGTSEDVLEVLKFIKSLSPQSPLQLLGYSLGGNIILKLLGELNREAEKYVEHAVCICPAVDLHNSACLIARPGNRPLEIYYLNKLREQIQRRHQIFTDLPKIEIPATISLFQFDEIYTSVLWKFKGAMDYYDKCSANRFIHDITVPCDILFSEDDPVIDPATILHANWPKNIRLWRSPRGGAHGIFRICRQRLRISMDGLPSHQIIRCPPP